MRKLALLLLSGLMAFKTYSQTYTFSVDLNNCIFDRLTVSLTPPELKKDTLVYQIAKVVPGTYMIKDYSRYVRKFSPLDANGKKLKVKYNKKDNNFVIFNAKNLSKIEYEVNDTWDDPIKNKYIFQPGGTNFEANKVFVLNTQGLFGYFEGYKHLPYEITITRPKGMYGTSSNSKLETSATFDKYLVKDFPTLVDNPFLYCKPDTTSFSVDGTKFNISVFSRNNLITSTRVKKIIKPVLAQPLNKYFGKFPIGEYNFVMFFSGWQDEAITRNGGFGALEHKTSSLYFLPETVNDDVLKNMLDGIVSHEFLHILTPLSLRSKEIHDFDFKSPKMSQHLWLYEGATEYFSNLVLVQDSLISLEDFFLDLRGKMVHNDKHQNLSFTEMSKNIFDNDLNTFRTVYNKGALLAMLLDIRIIEITNGKSNLKDIVFKLNETYEGSAFEDDALFNNIETYTSPAINDFINEYIIGSKDLPLKEYFDKIGIAYTKEKSDSLYYCGNISLRYDIKTKRFLVDEGVAEKNIFGLQKGDQVVSINGRMLTEQNYYSLFKEVTEPKSDEEISVSFERFNYPYTRSAAPRKIPVKQFHFLETESQKRFQDKFFNRI